MKILLINNRYPTENNPQPGAYVKSMRECMELTGAKVDILVMDQSWKGGKQKLRNYLKYYQEVFKFPDYSKYDLVYINHFPHIFPALRPHFGKMKRALIHWHGTEIFAANRKSAVLNAISHKLIPKRFQHIAPSNYFKEVLMHAVGISSNKITVSPSGGVDTEVFKPISVSEDSPKFVLGFTSAITEEKGADLLVSLAKAIPTMEKQLGRTIEIKLIAYGKQKDQFIQQIGQYVKADVIAPVPKEEMADLYNSFSLLLFPTRGDSLGLVALEAMACGIPVVGSNDFGLKEYLESGQTGEAFPTGDGKAFVGATLKTLQQLDNYNPRKVVLEKYSKQSVVRFYLQMFKDLED
ncbi:MAG: glycosyltransferase involved in cell wall biosynthesis [Granulosicoccus sp.]|jgi:glycosyltransferase involved in cell wall biosynthesis